MSEWVLASFHKTVISIMYKIANIKLKCIAINKLFNRMSAILYLYDGCHVLFKNKKK